MTTYYSLFNPHPSEPKLRWMIVISILVHFIMLAAFIGRPPSSSKKIYFSPVYSVSLVELPIVSKQTKTKARLWQGKSFTESHKKFQAKRDHTLLTIPGKSMAKEKEITKEQEASDRLSPIKGSAPEATVRNQDRSATEMDDMQGPSEAALSSLNLRFSRYYQAVWQKIRQAWLLPEYSSMQDQLSLEAIVVLKVRRDGKILASEFEKKSGNAQLDRSVERAIKKADPLPPLPDDFREDFMELGLRFIPTQQQQ